MEAKHPEKSRLGADVDQRQLNKATPTHVNESTPNQAALRREVWRRAQSRCEKCGSNYALEIDHILPRAKGGDDSKENLRLLCRSCNQRAAAAGIYAEVSRKRRKPARNGT